MKAVCNTAVDFGALAFQGSDKSINHLPPEILILCFLCLPDELRARLNVSQVSRKWRELCLFTPALWTNLTFDHDARYFEIVSSTMARSRNLPLHLNCINTLYAGGEVNDDAPPEAWELLHANMSRIRHLEIEWGTSSYHPILPAAPILEVVWYDTDTPECGLFTVPGQWGGDGAPILHTLEVSYFLLPRGGQPFRALRNFRGTMVHSTDFVGYISGYSTDARHLFQLFPALKVLRLCNVRSDSQLPEGACPESLEVMYLDSKRDEKLHVEDIVEYGPFVRGCTGFPLRHLYLEDADTLDPIVEYYIREVGAVDGLGILPYGEKLFEDSNVVLRSKQKPAILEATISTGTLTETHTLRASISLMVALRHFTCTEEIFKSLVRESFCIPTLKVLDVQFAWAGAHKELARFTTHDKIRLPRLRSLTVWCVKNANVDKAFKRMMHVLEHHLSFKRPKLALVTLMVPPSLEAVARTCNLDLALPLSRITELRVKD